MSTEDVGKSQNVDYIEGVVCNESDINENEMKLMPLGDDGGKVLLIKQHGQIHAIGSKCTHYGALLHTGALGDGRVRCPWHGACFNIKTGDIEDFPGVDSLPCYQVSINDAGLVSVRAKRKDLEVNKRTRVMSKFSANNAKTVVIIGGGLAGGTCAENLRQEGFTGRIIMVCKEHLLPYDRTKVSKALDSDAQKILLRSQLFYAENNIETLLGKEAIGLDADQKTVKLKDNQNLHYDSLVIATGSSPRMLNVPGNTLENIFTAYEHRDAAAIHAQLALDKHIVVLGFGFIGMEVAAYCIGKCASVTIIGRDTVPFKVTFGEEIGGRIKQEFENKGAKFVLRSGITKFLPTDDNTFVKQVELQDGTCIAADVVIIGIGSTFNTTWLKNTQLELLANGGIPTNKFLKTNLENIYACGDIAYAPVYSAGDVPANIGHYGLAQYHGKTAAANIAGKETPLKSVPFFWTQLFGRSYRYAGYGVPTSVKILGSVEDLKFIAYYFKNGKVIAMSSSGRDPIVADFANLLYEGRQLTEEEIERDPLAWIPNKPKDLISNPETKS